MNYVYENRCLIDSDENALLDISDFDYPSNQLYQLMGKSDKRKQSLDTNSEHEDSGFCAFNLSANDQKMVRFDDEMILLKALMKQENNPIVTNGGNLKNPMKALHNVMHSSRSKNGKYELKIISQPEEQHRARYLTEGSRGAIKDKSGLGHPIVKLCGYNKSAVKIQCFIGHDKQLGSSHLFYQASRISGKNSTRCTTKRVDGTVVIFMEALPQNDMQVTVDCVGILKERNVDVEQKLSNYKNKPDGDSNGSVPNKKRSTRCRLVFRAQIPDTNEVLQVVSSPILCTQPLGTPEICKKSVSESDAKGGSELFIIGKNFLKDAKVVWKGKDWIKVVEPDKEFSHPTHLVCQIPSYDGPGLKTESSVEVSLSIKSGGKYSDAHRFKFTNSERVNTMTLFNGTTAHNQLLVSSFEKPIILTMIGSTIANTMDTQTMVTQNSILPTPVSPVQTNSNTHFYTTDNSNSESVLSIAEDSYMSSTSLANTSQVNRSFDPISVMSFEDTMHEMPTSYMNTSIDLNAYTSDSQMSAHNTSDIICDSASLPPQPVSQYIPFNSFNMVVSSPLNVNNSSQMSNISTINTMATMNCNQMTTKSEPMSTAMSTEPTLTLITPMPTVESKPIVPQPAIDTTALALSENPVLTSTAAVTPVTQANNISALSEMSDAELLCFINPATFDQL